MASDVRALEAVASAPAKRSHPPLSSVRTGRAVPFGALWLTVATDEPQYRRWASEHAGLLAADRVHADTSTIGAIVRQVLQRVADEAACVQRDADGSVPAYMAPRRRRH